MRRSSYFKKEFEKRNGPYYDDSIKSTFIGESNMSDYDLSG